MGDATDNTSHHNGAIMFISAIIKTVMSLLSEAEYGVLFYNAIELQSVGNTLKEMVHT